MILATLAQAWVWHFTIAAASMIWIYGWLRAAEISLPKTKFLSSSQLSSLRFWPYYLALATCLYFVGTSFLKAWHVFPLVTIDGKSLYQSTGLGWANYIIWPLVNIIMLDFFQYWKHRAQHRFFWRFHAIHHSIENLSAVNSYHHWTDPVFNLLMVELPLAMLIDMKLPAFIIVSAFIAAQGAFIHSNTAINLGWFNRLFADNRFHRIHHSIEERHFDKNFGERCSIWDQLFGTAYFPRRGEWPQTGLAGEAEPRKTADYLWRPFRSTGQLQEPLGEQQPDRGPGVSAPCPADRSQADRSTAFAFGAGDEPDASILVPAMR